MNIITIFILAWIFVSVLEFSWGGFRKFFSIILFPGKLIKLMIRFKILERKIRKISFWMALDTSALYFKVTFDSSLEIIKFVLSPAPFLLILSFVFLNLSFIIPEISIILIWLSISFFISSLPEASDFEFIFLILTKKMSEVFGYLLWSIVVFTAFYHFLSFDIAVIATIFYFISILIFLLVIHEDEIIGGECEVIRNVDRPEIIVKED